MSLNKPVQLTFDDARKPTGHGGWRPGAGRKRGRTTVAHGTRDECSPHVPQHVTLCITVGISLRRDFLIPAIRRAVSESHKPDFGVAQFSVLTNHMHLITEARSKAALARGIQGLKVRIAHSINTILTRTGKLFSDRYHARALRTPAEVKNALRYVLNNARHHAAEGGKQLSARWFDPFSSAAWFDGWSTPLPATAQWHVELQRMPSPTRPATSWLLRVGWRRHGLLALDEVPGLPAKVRRQRK